MNRVTLAGNIASLIKETAENGTNYVKFSLAVRRKYTTEDGERITDFLYCMSFNPHVVKLMNQYTEVGDKLVVGGSVENLLDTDGKIVRTFINVQEIELVPNKRDDNKIQAPKVEDGDDSTLPF